MNEYYQPVWTWHAWPAYLEEEFKCIKARQEMTLSASRELDHCCHKWTLGDAVQQAVNTLSIWHRGPCSAWEKGLGSVLQQTLMEQGNIMWTVKACPAICSQMKMLNVIYTAINYITYKHVPPTFHNHNAGQKNGTHAIYTYIYII